MSQHKSDCHRIKKEDAFSFTNRICLLIRALLISFNAQFLPKHANTFDSLTWFSQCITSKIIEYNMKLNSSQLND